MSEKTPKKQKKAKAKTKAPVFHLVIVPIGVRPFCETHNLETLTARLKVLVGTDTFAYVFTGERLFVTEKPYHLYGALEGDVELLVPLFEAVKPEDVEYSESGYIGEDPAYSDEDDDSPPVEVTEEAEESEYDTVRGGDYSGLSGDFPGLLPESDDLP